MNKRELSQILAIAGGAFSNAPDLTPIRVESWFELFKDLDPNIFKTALFTCVKQADRRFFPTPGEVQSAINNISSETSALWTPEQIWNQLINHAGRGRSENEIRDRLRDYPKILAAVRFVTWQAIRETPIEDLHWIRKEFISAYTNQVRAEEKIRVLEITESGRKALPVEALKLIGKSEK